MRLATMLRHVAGEVLGVVGSNLTISKLEPTTPNMSQHIAAQWPKARNMLLPTMLQYVALACQLRPRVRGSTFTVPVFTQVNK